MLQVAVIKTKATVLLCSVTVLFCFVTGLFRFVTGLFRSDAVLRLAGACSLTGPEGIGNN